MDAGPPWTTPSELAEYTFCPRALHYRRTREALRTTATDDGAAYHTRRLSSERWRDEHRRIPTVAVCLGLALVALAIGLVVL